MCWYMSVAKKTTIYIYDHYNIYIYIYDHYNIYIYMRGLDAKRVISQKVKIEFLPVLCCHVVDSSTLKVL